MGGRGGHDRHLVAAVWAGPAGRATPGNWPADGGVLVQDNRKRSAQSSSATTCDGFVFATELGSFCCRGIAPNHAEGTRVGTPRCARLAIGSIGRKERYKLSLSSLWLVPIGFARRARAQGSGFDSSRRRSALSVLL